MTAKPVRISSAVEIPERKTLFGENPFLGLGAITPGFETPTEGTVLIDGQDVSALAPYRRPVNMVFQSYALYPHMSMASNLSFGLKLRKTPKDEIVDVLKGDVEQRIPVDGEPTLPVLSPDGSFTHAREEVDLATSDFSRACFNGDLDLWQHAENVLTAMQGAAAALDLDGRLASTPEPS